MRPGLLGSVLGGLLLLQGCTANVESAGTGGERLPAVVAQRVTATVQREASRLVRLETERETFLTTPEHPFAVPGSGWVSAGRLVAGDGVVSERSGAVRLLSVRSEPVAGPVPVFNLSVASSHAYFVGTERVLVHNTKCNAGAFERLTRELEELNRDIEALAQTAPGSRRLADLRARRETVQRRLSILRRAQGVGPQRPHEAEREAAQGTAESDADHLDRVVREEIMSAWRSQLFVFRSTLRRASRRRDRLLRLREKVSADGRDTSKIDRELKAIDRELERATSSEAHALRVERAQLQARVRLLGPSAPARGSAVRDEADGVDADRVVREEVMKAWGAKLAEFRMRLQRANRKRDHVRRKHARALADGRDTREIARQLAEVDRELEEAKRERDALRDEGRQLTERELARVGREPLAPARGSAVREEADEVNALLNEREELMEQPPSPERAAELASSSARLEQELREERAAVEVAVSALANEQAQIQRAQAGSSRGPSWQERVRAIQEEQAQLLAQWRAGLEERLDSARQRLHARQSIFALRDEAIMAELGREIALLERHLQM